MKPMHPDDKFILIMAFITSFTIGFVSAWLRVYIGGFAAIVTFFAIYYLYKRITKWHAMKRRGG